jgi:predicted pyridoxine 5'-phosphate oxidase superfamily flavin-nucleotide-binding protein
MKMAKMSDELMDMIKGNLCYLATASKNGVPDVAPIGSIAAANPETIVMAAGFMKRSYENMQQNPRATVLVHSALPAPKTEISAAQLGQVTGARIQGKVSLLTSGEVHEKTKAAMTQRFSPDVGAMLKATVVLKVEEIRPFSFGP